MKGDEKRDGMMMLSVGCGNAYMCVPKKDWAQRPTYDDMKEGRRPLAEDRPRPTVAELCRKAQDLVDKAQAVIDRRGIDEALASEICMVHINEYARLAGVQVTKGGRTMDARTALAESLDKMTIYMAGLPPW